MGTMNRIWTSSNIHQQYDKYKRVLCVCSAGLLRSPTTAVILAGEPFNFNTRAAGAEEDYALIPVDEVLMKWADEIVCMEDRHAVIINEKFPNHGKPLFTLNVPDNYPYRNPKLVELIAESYKRVTGWNKEPITVEVNPPKE